MTSLEDNGLPSSTEAGVIKQRPKQLARKKFNEACATLGPDDIALDCGANVGEFTELLARTGCQVFAFEPDPYAFSRLSERLANFPNARLMNAAVSTVQGTA